MPQASGKKTALWMTGCLLLVFTTGQAEAQPQVTFIEQEVSLLSSTGQEITALHRIWFDERRLRGEVTVGDRSTVALVDLVAGQVTLLFSDQQTWWPVKLDDYLQAVAARLGSAGLTPAEQKASLEVVSESENFAGRPCRKVLFRLSGTAELESEVWVSQEATLAVDTYFTVMQKLGLQKAFPWLSEELHALGGLPLYSTTKQKLGGVVLVSHHRLKTLEAVSLDEKLFEVPAGFRPLIGNLPPDLKKGGLK